MRCLNLDINLTAEERAAFDEVQRNNLRLEQEKVPSDYSVKVISRMTKEGKI
jgi:mannose/fructose/N-acetylgalactosamine-specific phosphotransferase system component IIB